MRRKRRITIHNPNPFVEWLIQQAKIRRLSLTTLSRQAGLGNGTLRSIARIPGRKPSVNTCLRLAHLLDIPHQEVLQMAGLSNEFRPDELPPNFQETELMETYRKLPVTARQVVVQIALMLEELTARMRTPENPE